MGDLIVVGAMAFLMGGCVGGLIMNEVIWRKQRDELAVMRRDLDAHCRMWDAAMAELQREAGVR